MPRPSSPAVRWQFSLQSLLVVTAMTAIALGFAQRVGYEALVHYCLMLFVVGPWFVYLASECLPIRTIALRTAVANLMLLALFIVTLKLAESVLAGPVVVLVALAAILLWTPQYMIFFVWKNQLR